MNSLSDWLLLFFFWGRCCQIKCFEGLLIKSAKLIHNFIAETTRQISKNDNSFWSKEWANCLSIHKSNRINFIFILLHFLQGKIKSLWIFKLIHVLLNKFRDVKFLLEVYFCEEEQLIIIWRWWRQYLLQLFILLLDLFKGRSIRFQLFDWISGCLFITFRTKNFTVFLLKTNTTNLMSTIEYLRDANFTV